MTGRRAPAGPPPASARAQVTRLLALAPYLQRRGEVPLDEVAADFGVSPAQMVRDLKVLYWCGLPDLLPGDYIDLDLEALEDRGVVRIEHAPRDLLVRPLRLGSNEASALIVALRALRDASTESSREVVERTLGKLESAVGAGAAALSAVHLGPAARREVAGARAALERAVATDRQVRLEYYVPARDETTTRVVDPIAVLHAEGHDYLDAWCHLAEARRLFRVDRVTGLEVLDTARERHDVAPRDLGAGLFAPGPHDTEVRLRLTPEMRWFAEYYPVESTAETGDGGLEVTMLVGDERWLLRLALRFGPDLVVLEPAGLRARVAAAARDALSCYRGRA